MTDPAATLQPFLKTLGVRTATVEAGAACQGATPTCATFDKPTMTLTVCADLCPGRRDMAMSRVLERL